MEGGHVPQIGEYWRVGTPGNYFFVVIETVENDGIIGVNFFQSSPKGTGDHSKNDRFRTIGQEDLERKVKAPEIKEKGSRTFYTFEDVDETEDMDF